MKKIIIILFIFATGISGFAQELESNKYIWDTDPKPYVLKQNEEKESQILLIDSRINEFFYDEKGNLNLALTRHRRIKLNNDKAIEENNKVFISMYNVIESKNVKARTISKDGKVKELDKENIKNVDNYENAGPYKIFAFEGVEVGSEVEYFYTVIKPANVFGTEYFQSETPRKKVEFTLITPSNLKFEAKSYNGFPSMEEKGVEDKKRFLKVQTDSVDGIKKEKYSAYGASLARIEYKMAYNEFKGDKRLLTWNDASALVFDQFVIDKKDLSKLKSFYKKIKVDNNDSEEQKIRKIESYLKNNIIVKEEYYEGADEISFILKNKFATKKGMVKMFVALIEEAGIDYELVLTCNRMEEKFDGDFDTWNYLDEYLVYFPVVKEFVSPSEMFNRFGFVPANLTGTKGLFIKPYIIGDHKAGVGKIKDIPAKDYKKSYDNIFADINLNLENNEAKIKLKREFYGYSGIGIQPVYGYIPDDNKKELIDNLLKLISEETVIENFDVKNYDENSITIKPFIVEGNVKTNNLLEKAGNKFLLKIGNVIGPQVELYQEDARKTDAENEFNRGYYREIVFYIPEGYAISNLDILNINIFSGSKDNPDAEFVSRYKIDGNKVTITIDENYRKLIFPKTEFEQFRKVINAAADFNKLVLFLEKK